MLNNNTRIEWANQIEEVLSNGQEFHVSRDSADKLELALAINSVVDYKISPDENGGFVVFTAENPEVIARVQNTLEELIFGGLNGTEH